MSAAKRAIDPATAREIQTYVDLIRKELDPLTKACPKIVNDVGILLIAIDEATGKSDPD